MARRMITAVLALAGLVLAGPAALAQMPSPPGRVVVQHEPPTNPTHQAAFERMRSDPTFARSRDFFSLFRLPRDLTFRTRSCSGRGGAWYYEGTVTICYEYIQNLIENAADARRPDWVSDRAALSGPIADVVLHEGAHALFEFFRVPLLGREEDAADMISTFAILNLFGPEAPDLISGVAYSYLVDARARNFGDLPTLSERLVPSRTYGGAHSTPLQRLFSVVCHASGFDEPRFTGLVARSELPPWRAGGCEDEYKQIASAFQTLLMPHVDASRARALFPNTVLAAGQ